MEWQNPEQQQVYLFIIIIFFTKPPSSITLTQAMYEEFSLHPSLSPQILQLSK